jgi:hypothetical protein
MGSIKRLRHHDVLPSSMAAPACLAAMPSRLWPGAARQAPAARYDSGETPPVGMLTMSFWKSLFGGGSSGRTKEPEPVEYNGYLIRPAPFEQEGQYQTAGTIEKDIAGARKQHRFIRADRHPSHEAAVEFTVLKARQIVDQMGDRMFDERA